MSVQQGVNRLGNPNGKSMDDFKSVLGEPEAVNVTGGHGRLLQWRTGSNHIESIAVVFDSSGRFSQYSSMYHVTIPDAWLTANHPDAGAVTLAVAPAAVAPRPPSIEHAGRRFCAAILDVSFFCVLIILPWLIWHAFLWRQATSPGKRLVNLRIVSKKTGAPASVPQLLIRELIGKFVLGVMSGFMIPLIVWVKWQVVLWDYIAKTSVIHDPNFRGYELDLLREAQKSLPSPLQPPIPQ